MAVPLELVPGVWAIDVVLDDYSVRGALVSGDARALVWDTLSHPRDMAAWLPRVGERDLVIAYSHADWDHVWGTAGLPSSGARIVGHHACLARFDTDVPVTLSQKQAAEPGRWDAVRLVRPTEAFASALALDLGGISVSLHHLPGHTPDCIVGFVEERGVLLAGDTVETPCPVIPRDSALEPWISELRRWAADERVRTVVPAHGPIAGRELLQRNIEYLEAIAAGRPLDLPGPLTAFYRETHRANVAWRAGLEA
jgi:glyoxylase-like metal-dependent hydrolase (beta-lactamase superfamily II)